ncbi:hypothetical protein SCHPADRAFT_831389 [Schizopora paradoxa]|uniref:Chitobiosyldiphosphodolichol beta-mannosyltransferase n=1 Tax=Schizopora paradoxa TaxID=27342 RepID=A0A0H2RP89_9AGAM|nr:hypothetical protein SCHPADRAFT_831389 [Schizopora paradoxa]
MMYHAESFVNNEFETYLIGYKGSSLIPSLNTTPRLQTLYLWEIPRSFRALPFIILAPIKVLFQVTTILVALLVQIPPPEYLMVQNPPSIPTLALVWLVCKIRGSKLIIDWHNLGYTILALRFDGKETFLVKAAKRFEQYFGQRAYLHLFVTKAMRDKLSNDWKLIGTKTVLYDRPPAHFHRSTIFESHELFSQLSNSLSTSSLGSFLPNSDANDTPFTHLSVSPPSHDSLALASELTDGLSNSSSKVPSLRPDRPALLVSSTSWTTDERFDMLLEALRQYEKKACEINSATDEASKRLPKVLVIVTGKGEGKERYMNEVVRLERDEKWTWVRLRSMWLEASQYPTLLGSADLGISMHASSSKLDLPMKVVDMFGCGLPVEALSYDCISELVKQGKNGYIFRDAGECCRQIVTLLTGFPASNTKLQQLRNNFDKAMRDTHSFVDAGSEDEWEWGTWSENWNKVMKPLLLKDVERDHEGWR